MIETEKKSNVESNGKPAASKREKMTALIEKIRAEPDFKPLSREEIRREVTKRRTGNFDE